MIDIGTIAFLDAALRGGAVEPARLMASAITRKPSRPRPFFFGDEPTGVDAIVFGTLASTVLTPIESPIRDFLRSQPGCVAYAERMRDRFFPEFSRSSQAA
jgi:glutathione S-transferase